MLNRLVANNICKGIKVNNSKNRANHSVGQEYDNKTFNEGQIKYYQQIWNDHLNVKYRENKFWKNIFNTLFTKKSLTENQFRELDYLVKNGKSRYEDKQISNKY